MAYTTVDNPELHHQTKTFSGNNGTNAITLDGSENMQPDWVWIKQRNGTTNNHVMDSVRGAGRYLYSNLSNPEGGDGVDGGGSDLLVSFDSDGFTLDAGADSNASSATGVGWCWKVGTSFSNDASATSVGTIDSSGKVDTPGAVSIVSWTGTGSAGTIKHGLSTTPKMIWVKRRDADDTWWVYNETIGNGAYLALNSNAAKNTSGASGLWNSTSPTSSVFSVGTNTGVNGSGGTYIAYCFADVKGYSKVGSYKGNGNASGAYIYTGFLPAWSIVKPVDVTQNW